MSVQNEEEPTPGSQSEGEGSGKHSIMATLKTSVIWLVVILAILVVVSWAAVEFDFLPKAPAK